MSGCAKARATGLSEKAAGEATDTKGVDATEGARRAATEFSLKTDILEVRCGAGRRAGRSVDPSIKHAPRANNKEAFLLSN
ncbi:hypothetical protein M3A49_09585 [Paraburkholderia sp. CNPSo 3076]|uniref:hypothetical protein n=1 Tax=Paraburkholderia sp. CNPSo 3076 TaxID=2940936 RepID=UPI00225B4E40|nr:hypothetical protein [Paraburkholderia sp. CNPSo 3076]MCX5539741.1 hypothetical protein [Paraburkholderia sp. CNPSo 3076]